MGPWKCYQDSRSNFEQNELKSELENEKHFNDKTLHYSLQKLTVYTVMYVCEKKDFGIP